MAASRLRIPGKGIHGKIDLTLDPRLTILTGPNGSGKTQLLDRLADAPPDGAPSVVYRLSGAPFEVITAGDGKPSRVRLKLRDKVLDRVFPVGLMPGDGGEALRTRQNVPAKEAQPEGALAVGELVDAIERNPTKLVLIDLPELYLDPDAQRRILPALLEVFPETQFVVATHSPLVAASVREAKLVRLVQAEGAAGKPGKWEVCETDLHRQAMTPQEFLREVMGLEMTLPLWAEAALREHEGRIGKLGKVRGDEKRAWAELKRQAEEAGLGRLLLDTLKPFLSRGRK